MAVSDIEKKVGQLIVAGIPGPRLETAAIKIFQKIGLGGLCLFKHNYENLEQLVELTSEIQKHLQLHCYKTHPLWIAVDQEGGRVQRFKNPFTVIPPQAQWGKVNSPKTCFEAGFIIGKELRACGININFAPVIDVLQTEARAIGDRSYGSDANMVANLGSATVRGLQKSGIMAVAKHFPGHGGVKEDSHEELPVCDKTVDELEALDWIPFKRVARSRCEGIMTAHIMYPKIDASRPATLSRKFLQDYLRKSVRFSRLIFSDDLEMGAISKRYEPKEAAFLAVEAGCDQLIFGHKWEVIEEVCAHLSKAFSDGVLPMSRLDESVQRITESKTKLLIPYRKPNIEEARLMVGNEAHQRFADALVRGEAFEGNSDSDAESEDTR